MKVTIGTNEEIELTERENKIYRKGWAEGSKFGVILAGAIVMLVVLIVHFANLYG